VRDFHLRPVGWENITVVNNKGKLDYTEKISLINEQMEKSFELESSDFHVYGIRHKFNTDFSVKKLFKRCWSIPLIPTFGADGNVYLCFDMRGRKDTVLCRHDPDPCELLKIWNTDFHRNIVRGIDVSKCPRCTFSFYNETVEKAIIEDRMCINFP